MSSALETAILAGGLSVNRGPDWWRQAQADFRHAQNAQADGDWEWAAFAAQQAGEKALKALVLARG